MAGKDPSMPFYVNDWLSSMTVTCMSLAEQGAYVRLLCHCWASQDASLPDDDTALAAVSGLVEGWLSGGSSKLRKCFVPHPEKPGFLTNEKLYRLWQERQKWRQKSSEGGRKSAESRRLQGLKGGSTTVSTKPQPNGNSSSSSSSSINTPLPPTGGDDPVIQTIVEAWNAIPDIVKVSKLTPKRLRALKARLKEPDFRKDWRAGLQAVSASEFLRGLIPGKDWRADFDWFLKPESLTKLIEGKFQKQAGQPGTRPAAKPETTDTAAGPLLRISTEEAADPTAFNDWIDRQQSFELNDGTRRYLHAVRCNVKRLQRNPDERRNQLYARLHDRARGVEIESPGYDDWEQAKADLEAILQPAGGAE